jgi:serine/threonine protein kinase
MSTDLKNPPGVSAAPEAPPSTGIPAFDLELRLAGADVTELALTILGAARRLDVPLTEELPPMIMPAGDIVDRQLTRAWTIQLRGLPGTVQAKLPTLIDLLARVEFAVGEFQNAQRDFMAAALIFEDAESQALARFHAYRSALERPHLPDASVELRQALALAARRFTPVPLDRFDPEQVVYNDCLGATIRCKTRGNIAQAEELFLRTLNPVYLSRPIGEIFDDQKKLSMVKQKALLPVRGTGHAGDRQLPFITTAYYEGTPLDQYVQRSGVIAPKDFVPLLLTWVEALEAAHQAGVYHRCLRPDYVWIRRKVSGFSGVLTNFGLPLAPTVYQHEVDNPASLAYTAFGRTLANALDYVPPEQQNPQSAATPEAADVYGLGKIACLALFGTPHPSLTHWRMAGESLAGILHECVLNDPARRPTVTKLKDRLKDLLDPNQAKIKLGSIDPKMAALIASYQPPPGVGMATMPVVPAGIPVRRRLSGREVLWAWRFQMMKWGSVTVITLMVAAVIIAIFWNPGAPVVSKGHPVTAHGVLTILDKPIANAKITLVPESGEGRRPHAITDSNGQFVFTTFTPGDGAPPGRYRVIVEKEPVMDRARIMPNVPETDKDYRRLLVSPLIMDSEVHQNYSRLNPRDNKLSVTIEPTGSPDIRIVLNWLGN